ncbi:helix-turn-helix domain-containing protein [Nesterenkonia massiliensis]|uniref:Helix-turn-helix domain-containing protein n=1 Tax=Nesterenkonia massiliensis TaxID=1232429 RepID=A0ABT2HQQ7_9MICC|nr:helix-turn-helix domain-containing protein [Nesterenkonia massiliensis]MCT1607026.1 helix-turn-helix domain-containing protein [Nesterenkonia massiliensis]
MSTLTPIGQAVENTANNQVQLLTIPDTAKALGSSRHYVYELIRTGKLAYIDLSNGSRPKLRVDPRDLDEFIQSRKVAA